MSKIKNVHCFGTSFTAGGGFEWETENGDRRNSIEKMYGNVNIPKSQWDFSFPGRLQTLFKDNNQNIKVYNHGKQGYGNERVYRKVFDVILSKDFKKEENLFIIEFSWLNRREFFLNEINDYVICNYGLGQEEDDIDGKEKLLGLEMASSYFYDNQDIQKMLYGDTKYTKIFFDFLELTLNPIELEKEVNRNLSLFISFLNNHGINYYISSLPPINPEYSDYMQIDYNKVVTFSYDGVDENYLEKFISMAHISISDETNNEYDDFHAGLFGNTLIATQIYNKLIQNKEISGNILNSIPNKIDLNI